MVSIRRAVHDDVDPLARLHLDTVLFAYRDWFPPEALAPDVRVLTDLWANDVAGAHAVFVADERGVIVGSAVARASGDLARVHVHPSRWGEGIGQQLHDAAVDALRTAGHSTAGLWVIAANERARSLYERNGWELDPERTLKEVGVIEVRYRRDLR